MILKNKQSEDLNIPISLKNKEPENLNRPNIFNNGETIPTHLNKPKIDNNHILKPTSSLMNSANQITAPQISLVHTAMNGMKGVDKVKQLALRQGKDGEGFKMSKLLGKESLKQGDLEGKSKDSSRIEVPVVLVGPKKGGLGGGAGKNEFLRSMNGNEGGYGERGGEGRKKMTPSGVNEKV